MKIAILSDSHDHVDNLRKAISQAKNAKAEAVIFCGDMCAPATAKIFAESGLSVYAVFGNCDEDQYQIAIRGGDKFKIVGLSAEIHQVELEKRKIAICHYPRLADLLSKTDEYDAVFFGHTHQAGMGNHGKTLLLNPGAVCGIKDGKYDEATFAIYDTASNVAELDIIK
jgi:hypothetical protein